MIGGNNVAMEVARCLLRSKVDRVTVIYPRSQVEMPANQRNIKEAEKEGVQFLLMVSPPDLREGWCPGTGTDPDEAGGDG